MTKQLPIDDEIFKPAPRHEPPSAETLRVAIEQIFSDVGLHLKSSLTSRQLRALIRASVFADKYQSEVMRNLVISVLQMKVSHKARGRDDLVAALKSTMGWSQFEDDSGRKHQMRDKLAG